MEPMSINTPFDMKSRTYESNWLKCSYPYLQALSSYKQLHLALHGLSPATGRGDGMTSLMSQHHTKISNVWANITMGRYSITIQHDNCDLIFHSNIGSLVVNETGQPKVTGFPQIRDILMAQLMAQFRLSISAFSIELFQPLACGRFG